MIDFHTHIMPDIDDGAEDMNETIEIIKEANKVGFETVILTSHYMENYYQSDVKERTKILCSIKSILKSNNINTNLVLGSEVYFSDNIIEFIKNKNACTINNTKYVLFELPFNVIPENLYHVVYNLLKHKYKPILAHPERYSFIQKDPNLVAELIEKGVLIQSNYGSFIGQYGKKAQIIMKKLLKNQMIHFLGTDVHKKNTIYSKIPSILSSMEKYIGKEKLDIITTINPQLVLENQEIEVNEIQKIQLSLFERIIIKKT